MGTLSPDKKKTSANPLPRFTFRNHTTDKPKRRPQSSATLLYCYTTKLLPPPPFLSVRVEWWEKQSTPDYHGRACCAFSCVLPAAFHAASLQTENCQPTNTLSKRFNYYNTCNREWHQCEKFIAMPATVVTCATRRTLLVRCMTSCSVSRAGLFVWTDVSFD